MKRDAELRCQHLLHTCPDREFSGAQKRPCFAGAWTGSLAGQVADWAESQQKRDALILLGGYVLLDWLLDTAATSHNSTDQATAERAVLSLLKSGGQMTTAAHFALALQPFGTDRQIFMLGACPNNPLVSAMNHHLALLKFPRHVRHIPVTCTS